MPSPKGEHVANVKNMHTEVSKWMSIQSSLELLLEVKADNDRVGPMAVTGLLTESSETRKWKVPNTLHYQVCSLSAEVC